MSIVCEAFGCVPSVALRELDDDADLVDHVLELRAAARAYRAYHDNSLSAKARKEVLKDPLVQEVQRLDFEHAQEPE